MKQRAPGITLLAVLLLAPAAHAQRSGGRFGASRSGGSSSGSRSSGGSWGSSRSSSGGRSYGYVPSGSRPAYVPQPAPPQRIPLSMYQFPSPVIGVLPALVGAAPQPAVDELTWAGQRARLEHRVRGADGYACPGISSLGIFLGFVALAGRRRALALRTPAPQPLPPGAGWPFGAPGGGAGYGFGNGEVRRVSVGFDWNARAQLQRALERIAGAHNMATEMGMYAAAQAAQQLLLSAVPSARYATFQRFDVPRGVLQPRFEGVAADLNSRYEKAIVSNARREGPMDVHARAEEGRGLVVVSIVVGVTSALPPLPEAMNREAVGQALMALLPARPGDLLHLEVVWSPAQDSDRMSSAELEKVYPELLRLDADSPLGRVACAYCRVVYAAELERCPACGAGETVRPRTAEQSAAMQQAAARAGAAVKCRYCGHGLPAYETQCQNCGARVNQ